jgi:tripartite-type tricarboxylate transporter receptor subunit TctC
MSLRRRRFIQLATSVAALCAGPRLSQAQTYPSRIITLVVPFPPGGSTDVAGRILADRMAAALGQSVIIENVGGAGGSIGVGRVARAIPDGYTIDIGQWDTHVAAIIYNVNYDLQTAFAPIGLISLNPQLLVARRGFPADDLKSLVAWLKAHPGEAKLVNQVAAAQVGGSLLEKLTDTKVLFVPYRGAGPGMTDLISGQVDLMIAQAAVMMPQVRAGTIKALVNLSPQRSSSIADIPTSDEAGVPGLYISGWFGLFAPRATPSDIITKLNSAMVQALADPAVQKRFTELGLDIPAREQQTPDALAAFQKVEIEKWWPIIKAAGIRGD